MTTLVPARRVPPMRLLVAGLTVLVAAITVTLVILLSGDAVAPTSTAEVLPAAQTRPQMCVGETYGAIPESSGTVACVPLHQTQDYVRPGLQP